MFCLPPGVQWFQGHFAYTAVGGCSASLGVLGTELPVDPVGTTFASLLWEDIRTDGRPMRLEGAKHRG